MRLKTSMMHDLCEDQSLDRVFSVGPIVIHFGGKRLVQFQQQVRLELFQALDFSFHLLVLCKRLLHTVLGIQLRILVLVDVIEEYLEWHVHILYLWAQFVDFLQSSDQTIAVFKNKRILFSTKKSVQFAFALHFLVEYVLSLWLEIADDYTYLAHVLDEHFQLSFQILQRGSHFRDLFL